METIQIGREDCEKIEGQDQLFYKGHPLVALSSEPQESETLAREQLSQVQDKYAKEHNADMQYKYSFGGVRIWNDKKVPVLHIDAPATDAQMTPDGTFVAYELFALSGVNLQNKT